MHAVLGQNDALRTVAAHTFDATGIAHRGLAEIGHWRLTQVLTHEHQRPRIRLPDWRGQRLQAVGPADEAVHASRLEVQREDVAAHQRRISAVRLTYGDGGPAARCRHVADVSGRWKAGKCLMARRFKIEPASLA